MAFDDNFKLADLVIDNLNWNVRCKVLELPVDRNKIWTLLHRNGSKLKRSRVDNHVASVRPILDRCSTFFASYTFCFFLYWHLLGCKVSAGKRALLLDNWSCKLFKVPEDLCLLRRRIDCLEDKNYDPLHCLGLLCINLFPIRAGRILNQNHCVVKICSFLLWSGVILHEISDGQA